MNSRTRAVAACMLASIAVATAASAAAPWPDKQIRVIVPWAPGGSTDIVGRILSAEMPNTLKQQVIIDNRAGGGSIVGMQLTAAAPPDGYTFMLTSTGYAHLIQKANVDLVASFEPVAMVGTADSALVVHPALPVKTVKDLIQLAKKKPGQLLYSSSGIGGFPHMNTELFKLKTGVDLVHVPFKGGGPAIADTVAGNTQIHLGSIPTEMAFIKAGKLKVIAVGGRKPNPALPGVPLIKDTVPGYETYIWYGYFAPKGTPASIISRMHAAVTAAVSNPNVVKKLDDQGVEVEKMSSAEFGKLMKSETDKWLEVINAAGIKGE
ncbi:MAG: tripartite tricarboxylate transporter substrate binding protein [Rhodospirillaceae bacterium]